VRPLFEEPAAARALASAARRAPRYVVSVLVQCARSPFPGEARARREIFVLCGGRHAARSCPPPQQPRRRDGAGGRSVPEKQLFMRCEKRVLDPSLPRNPKNRCNLLALCVCVRAAAAAAPALCTLPFSENPARGRAGIRSQSRARWRAPACWAAGACAADARWSRGRSPSGAATPRSRRARRSGRRRRSPGRAAAPATAGR